MTRGFLSEPQHVHQALATGTGDWGLAPCGPAIVSPIRGDVPSGLCDLPCVAQAGLSLPAACIYDSEPRVMENLNKGQSCCSQRERNEKNQGDLLKCQKIIIKNIW